MDQPSPHHALDEIVRLRGIAEEGRRLPLANGRYLILWGCAIATALAVQWFLTIGWLPLPGASIAWTWPAVMLGAAIVARHPVFSQATGKGRTTLGARVERTLWVFGGVFLALAPIGTVLAGWLDAQTRGPGHALAGLAGMPALTFGVYAIALAASAEVAAMASLKRYAALSLVFVPITLLLANSAWQCPVAAIGIVLVSVVPGRAMLAAEQAP